jgi:ATP-binding cassette subfamily A (ABC1) protein 3
LIENLTVHEQLELFYDMKCLPKKHKQKAIEQKIKELNLSKHQNKLSGALSGGNKRKLSVAMAMIGNPSILFLDEPSTGMDPQARRFMWKVISRISTEKKYSTVILTTHSMEEAEALSTRLGIMVNGNFKCIGTPQHIKSKYGKGFEIEIKVRPINKEDTYQFVAQMKIENTRVNSSNYKEVMRRMKIGENVINEISQHKKGSYIWSEL